MEKNSQFRKALSADTARLALVDHGSGGMCHGIGDGRRLSVVEGSCRGSGDQFTEDLQCRFVQWNDSDQLLPDQPGEQYRVAPPRPAVMLKFRFHHISNRQPIRQRAENVGRAAGRIQIDSHAGVRNDLHAQVRHLVE